MGVLNSDNHYERQYACKRCEFFTNNPRAVLYHRKDFHMEKINVHECSFCQYASQYSGKVERHTLLRHKIATAGGGSTDSAANTNKTPNATPTKLASDAHATRSASRLSTALSQPQQQQQFNLRPLFNGSSTTPSASPTTLNVSSQLNGSLALTNGESERFQCNECPCKYKRSSDLSKHLKLKHAIYPKSINEYLRLAAESRQKLHQQQQQQQQQAKIQLNQSATLAKTPSNGLVIASLKCFILYTLDVFILYYYLACESKFT